MSNRVYIDKNDVKTEFNVGDVINQAIADYINKVVTIAQQEAYEEGYRSGYSACEHGDEFDISNEYERMLKYEG